MYKCVYFLALTALALICLPRVFAFEPPDCEPGYTIVTEVHYKEVVHKICKPVPDVKRVEKWVYDCQPEEFCVPKCRCPLHGLKRHHGCRSCAACDKPRTRNLLVKRKVIEEHPVMRCVIEHVVVKVPYIVYRKVPVDGNAGIAHHRRIE